MAYDPNARLNGPFRSLDQYLAELVERHDRVAGALLRGVRDGANSVTLAAELRRLHSRIREVEAEIDARSPL